MKIVQYNIFQPHTPNLLRLADAIWRRLELGDQSLRERMCTDSLWTGSLFGEKNSKEREGKGEELFPLPNSLLDQRPVHRLVHWTWENLDCSQSSIFP